MSELITIRELIGNMRMVTKSKWHIPPFIEDIDKWLEEQRKDIDTDLIECETINNQQ